MRDTILEILEDIGEDVDFDTCETLIDDGILSSLDIIQLIGALNDEFEALGNSLGLKIHVMHEDVFNSMHRI